MCRANKQVQFSISDGLRIFAHGLVGYILQYEVN